MIRQLLKDSALYTLPVIAGKALNLVLLPVFTRILSPGEYGTLDLLVIFGGLVNLTVPLEVSQGVARYLAESTSPGQKKTYASTGFWFTFGCYALFLVFALSYASGLSRLLLGRENLVDVFRLAMGYIALNGIFSLLNNQLRWELRSKQFVVNNLITTLGSALASVILAAWLDLGLAGILWGMIIGTAAGGLKGLWDLRHALSRQFDSRCLKDMLRYSAPLAVSGLGVFINTYVDRLMLNHFLSLESVGLYGMALRVASLAGLVTVGFQAALTPLIFSRHLAEDTPAKLAQIFRFFVWVSLLLSLFLSLFSPEIMRLLTAPAYLAAAPLVICLAPTILLSQMYVFAPGLSLAKKTAGVLWINLLGGGLNFSLNLVLIPAWQSLGAAVSTLVSAAAVFAAYMFYSQKYYPVPHQWNRLLYCTGLGAALALAGSSLHLPLAAAVCAKAGLLVLAGGLFFQCGLIRQDEVTAVLNFFLRKKPP